MRLIDAEKYREEWLKFRTFEPMLLLDQQPTVEAIPKDQYEARLKADMVAILDKIRAEIGEYGSIWVEYKITGRRDKDIEQLVTDVLKQAKKQVLDVIDKYRGESEDNNGM